MLVAFFQMANAKVHSQGKVTLSVKDAPLEQVLKEISKQTGLDYAFQQQWRDVAKKVTVGFNQAPVEEVLEKCFKDQPFTYSIVKNIIVIKEREPTGGQVPAPATAPGDLTGRVVDDKNAPVPGASIMVRGSKKTAVTDEQGQFTLKEVEPDAVLTISSVGYYDTTMAVSGKVAVLVHLKIRIAQLGEAVVTGSNGFQQIPKERATGSFVVVDNALLNRRVSTDILSRLEGVVPGLLVNRNVNTVNNPNGIDISIQGYSTLFSNSQPLIVVDNFPYDGNINNINPNDIESITVLKDAAAASIWGVQSGNGVIVITTKKGKRNQKIQVSANANVTVANKPNLFYNPNFLDSKDFIDVEQSLFSQGYYDASLTDTRHIPVSPVVQLLADQRAGTISAADANTQINNFKNIDVRNDLSKYFYQKAVSQQYSVGIRGGGPNNDYALSAGYDKDRSGQVGNKNDRFTLNSLANFYPVKNLLVTTGLSYVESNGWTNSPVANISTGGGYGNIYPYAQLAGSNGQALPIVKDYNYNWITDPVAQAGLLNWQYKPLDELKFADNTTKLSDVRLIGGLQYSFLKGFSAEVKYQFEKSTNTTENYYSDSTYYARNLINQFTNIGGANQHPLPVGGILSTAATDLTSHRLRGQLNYHNNWDQHEVTVIAGSEVNQTISKLNVPATTYGYDKSNGSYQNVDYVSYFPLSPSMSYSKIQNATYYANNTNNYVSYYGNASYTYKNRYTLSGSGRIDKSNLFGVSTNQKSVPLYSAGLSWNFARERFYHVDWLPYGKLRATYGYNANLNTSATAVPTITQNSGSFFFGLPFAYVASPGNPALRWERIRKVNFGVDFALKNNFLSGSFDYYLKRSIDLFGSSPLAPSTGISTFFGNTANTKGAGYDLMLNFNLLPHNKFSWNTIIIVSHAIDKVSSYDVASTVSHTLIASASSESISPIVGKPIFSIFSLRSAGLTHDTGDPQGYLGGKLSTDYAGIINNATIDSLRFFGSSRPTLYGSLRNTLGYKNFSLSFNIVYKLNYYFRRNSIFYNGLFTAWSGNKDYNKRWIAPGDEAKTNVPSMPTVSNIDPNRDYFYEYSQSLVEKGDHVRLQDITLNYSWKPAGDIANSFKEIQFYLYVNNVGILWRANKQGLDPDLYGASLPIPRSYSLGVKANF